MCGFVGVEVEVGVIVFSGNGFGFRLAIFFGTFHQLSQVGQRVRLFNKNAGNYSNYNEKHLFILHLYL